MHHSKQWISLVSYFDKRKTSRDGFIIFFFLELKHADTYVPTNIDGSIKGRSYFRNIKNFNQLAKLADLHLRRTIIVAKQRNLRPLSQLFAFEFSPVPLSLCDSHNIDLFYQQTKTKAIEFLKKMFPWSF